MSFDKIAVIGTGLIGSSLILSFRRKKIGKKIIGIDLPEVIRQALLHGIIDEGYNPSEIREGIQESDLIVLATSIHQILELLPVVANNVKPGAIVTDVGSSKKAIIDMAQDLFKGGSYFIGGHPMAGSEKKGISAADPFLFENCFYILVPLINTPRFVTDQFANILKLIGSKVLVLDAEIHDQIAAGVSHLPQVLAVCLVNLIGKYHKQQSHFLKLAAGGFRDMTRIASSPFDVWKDIFETNEENILFFIDQFIEELENFKKDFEKGDLKVQFDQAARTRLSIPKDTKGFINPNYDLIIVVEDKPGVIATISTVLAEQNINIRDIEVLKVRLLEGGTLRIAFETEREREEAINLLNKKGFNCRKM